jgi:hypothetical protein
MAQIFTGIFDENWQTDITLGTDKGAINIPFLRPCGSFRLLVDAVDKHDVFVGMVGITPVTTYEQTEIEPPKNFKNIPFYQFELIDASENNNVFIIFFAMVEDQPTPVAVVIKLIRDGKKLTVEVI